LVSGAWCSSSTAPVRHACVEVPAGAGAVCSAVVMCSGTGPCGTPDLLRLTEAGSWRHEPLLSLYLAVPRPAAPRSPPGWVWVPVGCGTGSRLLHRS
jgi:hypothetical protein